MPSTITDLFNIITSCNTEEDKRLLIRSVLGEANDELVYFNSHISCDKILELPYLSFEQMKSVSKMFKSTAFYDSSEIVFKAPWKNLDELKKDTFLHQNLDSLKDKFGLHAYGGLFLYCSSGERAFTNTFSVEGSVPFIFENTEGVPLFLESSGFRFCLENHIDVIINREASKDQLKRADLIYSELREMRLKAKEVFLSPSKKNEIRNRTS